MLTTTLPAPALPTTAVPAIGGRSADPLAELLDLLDDALALVAADDDPDPFSSRTPAGAALTSLSSITRQAAQACGARATAPVTEGPGVVVLRDLVAAVRLLQRTAADRPADGGAAVHPWLQAARRVHATLRDLLTSAC